MADIVFVAANCHNDKAAIRRLRAQSRRDAQAPFTAAALSEVHRRTRMLNRFPGHDFHTGPTRGPAREVGLLLDSGLPLRGGSSEFLSTEATRFPSVGKERWGHDVIALVDGVEVAFIAAHPVGGPRLLADRDRDPLDRRYEDFTTWLAARLAHHNALGREWVFGGDVQLREGTHVPWNPAHVLTDHGAGGWVWEAIDVVAWSRGLNLVGNPRTRVQYGVLPDHPLIRAELNINRTKRRSR